LIVWREDIITQQPQLITGRVIDECQPALTTIRRSAIYRPSAFLYGDDCETRIGGGRTAASDIALYLLW
jgi:hypothetical protein